MSTDYRSRIEAAISRHVLVGRSGAPLLAEQIDREIGHSLVCAALEALYGAVKTNPHMQGREYIGLGIQVNAALAVARGEKSSDQQADGREGMPLRASVVNGSLTVSVGVKTLSFAFENSEANNPYDEDFADTKRRVTIADPQQFATDVCDEMNREGEDGSTPLTRLIDQMCDEAVNQGSLGIYDPEDESVARGEKEEPLAADEYGECPNCANSPHMGTCKRKVTSPECTPSAPGVSMLSDAEVIAAFMEPKPQADPGQLTPRHMLGSRWWDWSIGYGAFPKALTLNECHLIESRLTKDQWTRYLAAMPISDMPFSITALQVAVHLRADLKIAALASVLRQEGKRG